jgi:hypothetical protein
VDGGAANACFGQTKLIMNQISTMTYYFEDANALKLAGRKTPENITSMPLVPTDFYGKARGNATPPSALAGNDL